MQLVNLDLITTHAQTNLATIFAFQNKYIYICITYSYIIYIYLYIYIHTYIYNTRLQGRKKQNAHIVINKTLRRPSLTTELFHYHRYDIEVFRFVIPKVYRKKRCSSFSKTKKNPACDVFSASLLGIVKCTSICILQGVWELFSLVLFEGIKINLWRQKLNSKLIK